MRPPSCFLGASQQKPLGYNKKAFSRYTGARHDLWFDFIGNSWLEPSLCASSAFLVPSVNRCSEGTAHASEDREACGRAPRCSFGTT